MESFVDQTGGGVGVGLGLPGPLLERDAQRGEGGRGQQPGMEAVIGAGALGQVACEQFLALGEALHVLAHERRIVVQQELNALHPAQIALAPARIGEEAVEHRAQRSTISSNDVDSTSVGREAPVAGWPGSGSDGCPASGGPPDALTLSFTSGLQVYDFKAFAHRPYG